RTPLRLPQSPNPLLPRMHHPPRPSQPPRPQVAQAFSLCASLATVHPPRLCANFALTLRFVLPQFSLSSLFSLSSVPSISPSPSYLFFVFPDTTPSTSSYNAPFVANPSPPEIVLLPFQSVNRPPASSRIGTSGAASHSCSTGSSMISARPVATSTCP